jgi:hypothetical protein
MEKGKTMRRFLLFIGIMGLAACSGPSSSDVSEDAEGLEAKAVVAPQMLRFSCNRQTLKSSAGATPTHGQAKALKASRRFSPKQGA